MTAFDRFDPFERRITEAIDEIAATRPPEYLDDILQRTARTAQRPRWTFLERWLPVDTAISQPGFARRLSLRPLLVLALLAALVGGALVWYVGSQPRVPAPFGPAGNGQIVFGVGGDVYVVDTLTGNPRLLIGGDGRQGGAVISPDGRLIAYDNVANAIDHVWVADIDGSNARQVFDGAYTGRAFGWSPDSKSMLLGTDVLGAPTLFLAAADGSGATKLDMGAGFSPLDAAYDPLQHDVLLVRAKDSKGNVDLYYVRADGTILSQLNMRGLMLNGAEYEFSGFNFSPDGQTIAYNQVEAQESPVNRFRAHVMNRDGTNDRALPAPLATLYSQAWPIWSPDGRWIVMESWVSEADGTATNQLALAPSDGSAVARWIGPRIHGQTLVKTWSPDGTRILMSVVDQNEVYSIDPGTGSFEKLPWDSDLPDWQRVAK